MSLISEKVSQVAKSVILETDQLSVVGVLQNQGHVHLAHATYDHAVQSGAPGSYSLPLSAELPAGSICLGVIVECTIPFASSGTPTVDLELNGTSILNPAAPDYDAAPYNGGANSAVYNATKLVKNTNSVSALTLVIGNAVALDDGKFLFAVQYIL